MSTSAKLRDALGNRLLAIVATDEELQPAMVSACVNFLKAFPPPDDAKDLLARGDGTINGLIGSHITAAAQDGDKIAISALEVTGDWLGAGIATLAMLFDPSIVVIGGGVIDAGELLLAPARKAMMREMPFVGKHPVPEIVAAKLGNDAGLVGVADLSRD